MRTLASTISMAVLWMLLFGKFDVLTFAVGLVVGFGATRFSRPVVGSAREETIARGVHRESIGLGRRIWGIGRLAWLYGYELVRTNYLMARDVLRPRHALEPATFGLEVPGLGPTGITLLSNLITLTPGSVVVDLDERSETLYIHTIYAGEIEDMRRDYRRFARQICRVLGREPSAAIREAGR